MSVLTFCFIVGMPGAGEVVVVFLVVLLLFGPKRLPEIARMIGKIVEDLRRASQDFRDEIMKMDSDDTGAGVHDTEQAALDAESDDVSGRHESLELDRSGEDGTGGESDDLQG